MVFIHPAIDRCLLQSRRGVISWHPDFFIHMFRARGIPDIHPAFHVTFRQSRRGVISWHTDFFMSGI
jgi:hypothetical protein